MGQDQSKANRSNSAVNEQVASSSSRPRASSSSLIQSKRDTLDVYDENETLAAQNMTTAGLSSPQGTRLHTLDDVIVVNSAHSNLSQDENESHIFAIQAIPLIRPILPTLLESDQYSSKVDMRLIGNRIDPIKSMILVGHLQTYMNNIATTIAEQQEPLLDSGRISEILCGRAVAAVNAKQKYTEKLAASLFEVRSLITGIWALQESSVKIAESLKALDALLPEGEQDTLDDLHFPPFKYSRTVYKLQIEHLSQIRQPLQQEEQEHDIMSSSGSGGYQTPKKSLSRPPSNPGTPQQHATHAQYLSIHSPSSNNDSRLSRRGSSSSAQSFSNRDDASHENLSTSSSIDPHLSTTAEDQFLLTNNIAEAMNDDASESFE